MRYLLLNSLKSGGAERVAQTLSATGLFDGIILLERDCDYEVDIPVFFLSNHTYKTNRIWKTLFIPMYAWRINKIITKNDLLISFAERANFSNVVSSLVNKHKTVLTLHTNPQIAFKSRKNFIYYFLIKILYPNSDAIIPVSKGIETTILNMIKYNGIIKVINNPVDIKKIENLSKETLNESWNFLFNKQVIVNVGRLSWPKGQWNLLRIFSYVLKNKQQVKLLILGEGELSVFLKEYALKLGLKVFYKSDSELPNDSFDVFFLGYQENPYKFYKQSTIFVLSSLFEGLPMAIIEAMACGVPVISSDCNFGPREIINSLNMRENKINFPHYADFGILLPVPIGAINEVEKQSNDDVWIKTISNILDDKDKQQNYSKLSLKRVKDFSLEKIKKDWENLFKQIGT